MPVLAVLPRFAAPRPHRGQYHQLYNGSILLVQSLLRSIAFAAALISELPLPLNIDAQWEEPLPFHLATGLFHWVAHQRHLCGGGARCPLAVCAQEEMRGATVVPSLGGLMIEKLPPCRSINPFVTSNRKLSICMSHPVSLMKILKLSDRSVPTLVPRN